ncbi:zwei Ig domain protein zig-8-like [Rhagoletis pomonella]|uniref:zwei Ig domain protein zig-8-like n=1 Tax=Rhagoletis pomonella TaxID=28610 RepID=UPI001782A010|nr:zwei Ig domain protein zig-8-like [Rhagoletis pomonella]
MKSFTLPFPFQVAWIRHRDLHILTVGTYTYTTDQRFQTSYHRDIDEWTLQIKWAQQRDAGIYECQISTQPVRSFSVNLNIVVPTSSILGGPDLYVDRGSTINLTCVIKYSPEPPTHIFWYHQDKVLSEETSASRLKIRTIKSMETKSILLIKNADLLDSGKYSCYPSNTEITSIRVHVLQGERLEAMQTSSASTARYGVATYLSKQISAIVCALVLSQIFTFFWSKTGKVREQRHKDQSRISLQPTATCIKQSSCYKSSSSYTQQPQPPLQQYQQHQEFGHSVATLLMVALRYSNNSPTTGRIIALSSEQRICGDITDDVNQEDCQQSFHQR